MKSVIILGDFHIPTRAQRIPEEFSNIISSMKPFDYVLCTGDLVDYNTKEYVQSLGRNVYIVRGNMDYIDLPHYHIVKIESLKFGIIHGSEVYPRGNIPQLTEIALNMGVDVLVHGHTHVLDIKEVEAKRRRILLVNPGSITGVWSGGGGSLIPSFIISFVNENKLVVRTYELREKLIVKERKYTLP